MDNDLKVLWGIRDGYDLTKEITTVYLDCQVVDNEEKWMENYEQLKEYLRKNNKYHWKNVDLRSLVTNIQNSKMDVTMYLCISNVSKRKIY